MMDMILYTGKCMIVFSHVQSIIHQDHSTIESISHIHFFCFFNGYIGRMTLMMKLIQL